MAVAEPSAVAPPARLTHLDRLAIVAALLIHAGLTLQFWFVCDDAFISFRYALNLVETGRLAFNPGESPPVEGYSNFLWTLLSAGTIRFGLDPVRVMPLLSYLCGAALLLTLHRALRLSLRLETVPAAGAVLALACATPMAVWSTSGLETMPFALALFLLGNEWLLRDAAPRVAPAFAFALLAALLRVEGVLWVLAITPLALFRRANGGLAAWSAIAMALVMLAFAYGGYFAWRFAYFDTWLANSAAAKTGLGWAHALRGVHYVVVQALTYLPWMLALAGPLIALRRERRAIGLPVAALALATPAYAILAGGDFMAFGRFLVAGLPWLTVLLAYVVQDLRSAGGVPRRVAPVLALAFALLGLLPGWDVHLAGESLRARFHFRLNSPDYRSEFQQWRFQNQTAADFARKGLALRQLLAPQDAIVEAAIGAVGYYSRLPIRDQVGLVSPEVARRPPRTTLWRSPGHDRWVEPQFFLETGAPPAVLMSTLLPVIPRTDLPEAFRALSAELRGDDKLRRMYYQDFRPVQVRGEGTEPRFLVYWMCVPDGADARTLREAARARLRDSAAGRDTLVIAIDPPR